MHAHGHGHAPGESHFEASPQTHRMLLMALAPVVLVVLVGLVALWPGDLQGLPGDQFGFDTELIDGEVTSVEVVPCAGTLPEDDIACQLIDVRLQEGPDEGETITFQDPVGPSSVEFEEGDLIVLGRVPDAPSIDLAYQFADYQREIPLLALGLVFAVAVVALGRWRGLRALVGLAVSLLVLIAFVLPSILDGNNALAVSIVGSLVIMLVALYAAHGWNAGTTTAMLGTAASLVLIGVLALLFVAAARLTGLASEEAVLLRVAAEQVNLRGLLLGGIIIGSLGVLDDVTVTQVSAVWELRVANPGYSARELYRAALRIGRDHIASTVNTLVLAYAGAALPTLLLFTQANRGLVEVLTGEVVAIEVVRTLVGSIGLVASVPITTGLAAFVVTRADGVGRLGRPGRARRPRAEQEWRDLAADDA